MDKYTGKRLDSRYEIQELIGVGGMAYVYKAYDIINDRTVAIKILKEEYLGNQDFMRRFKNESKAIAMLDHPNIVKVFSVSFGDRMQYIVMEYIDGISLKEYMDRQETVNQKEAIHFTVQILKALQHAHENGIIHRDIKPQNIMLLQDGTIKVTDFGIARFSDSQTRTMTDKAIGSVHYIAPEQARGDLTDGKTDVYSVGVMLYELITGQLPFEADNAVSVAIMQLQTDPKPPREINPAIPVGLEEITLRAMQKNPQQRYPSAKDMLDDLAAFRRDPGIQFHYQYDAVQQEEPTRVVEMPEEVLETPVETVPAVVPVVPPRQEVQRYGDNYAYDPEESAEEEKKTGKKVGLIVGISAGAAAVAAGIVIALLFVFGVFGGGGGTPEEPKDEEIAVPAFVGQKWEDVQKNTEYTENFEFKVTYSEQTDKDQGIIISQTPSAELHVKKGSEVNLTVSSKEPAIEIPDVRKKSEADAITELTKAGFKTEIKEQYDDDVSEGKVIKTSPEPGTKATKDTTVILYISKGSEKVSVPNVVGQDLEDAQDKIWNANLEVGEVEYDYSDSVDAGYVISTSPGSGSKVAKGTAVSIVVSEGKKVTDLSVSVSMPPVSGKLDLSVYLDDELFATDRVTPSSSGYTFTVREQTGKHTARVYLDGQYYAEYQLDFDNGTVQQTASYQYMEESSQEPSSQESSSSAVSSKADSEDEEEYEGYVDEEVTSEDYKGVTD